MRTIVVRECTEVPEETRRGQDVRSGPLRAFREVSAYVLLGDPGSGKSTSFEAECEALGDEAYLVTARDFLTFDPLPEWRSKVLFIDGLDEVRAGVADVRTPFDAIRRKLDHLGSPRFRLSCREADWLGTNDRSNLARVAPDGCVMVLRLDPLTNEDIEQILAGRSGIDDARTFIASADEKGIGGLLRNPQCLNMLAEVVGDSGRWPASRLELFEAACQQMVREHNDEHIAAAQSFTGTPAASVGLTEDALLDAAGRLCAIQLIAGIAGYALMPGRETDDFLSVDRCGQLHGALATKLFSAGGPGCFSPVHRHVAEFLGARHLARLVAGQDMNNRHARRGLPARRVVFMMTGYDDMVVTELRGLSAWFAAQCQIARDDLIDRDPIGVGLYGDFSQFSSDEKRALLASLERQTSWLVPAYRAGAAFRALATPEMETAFREVLTGASQTPEHHLAFLRFVLSLLAQGTRFPDLSGLLLGIVRDETQPIDIRTRALDAFVHNHPDDQEKTPKLRALLADATAGQVSDEDGELLGTLLTTLSPEHLTPSDVWGHLSTLANPAFLGGPRFRSWIRLVDESSASAIAEHLNALAARQDAQNTLQSSLKSRGLQTVPVHLLACGLEALGDRVEATSLYDWLRVGLITDHVRLSANDSLERIRRWMGEHPKIQKALLGEGLTRCAEFDDNAFRRCSYEIDEIERRFYGSSRAPDFGESCLAQAETATDPRAAKCFLRHAMDAVHTRANDQELSLDVLERRVQAHDILAGIYAEIQKDDREMDLTLRQHEQRQQRHRTEAEREHQQNLDYIRSHEASLRENRCPPAVLHQLASAYFGFLLDAQGGTPRVRLENLFRGDEGLMDAALTGLRDAILRDDLPDIDEIIRLHDQRREHYLALPTLVSIEERDRTAPDELGRLETDLVRRALAFHYSTGGLPESESAWYKRIVDSRPELVADMLIRSARAEIRTGREHVAGLCELAYDHEHAQVAAIASLPLLRAFPIRCAARQMTNLCYLLWAALRRVDRPALLDLVGRKLSRTSMDVAQRGHWLAAGLILSPPTYLEPAERFAAGRELRIRHLFALFTRCPREMKGLEVPVLRLVIRLAGSTFRPWAPRPGGGVVTVTPEMSAAEYVQWMIRSLAELPTSEASEALEALTSDQTLSSWRAELIQARDGQRVVRRNAGYRHLDIEQICRTLNNGSPVHVGDLAALLVDRLKEIADRIKNGNTDDWRQYWNENSHARPVKPKPENSCRDALLSALQRCLPDDVDAHREGPYAHDKRADIRVVCRDFNVPIEIKKNGHLNLWSALRDQLVAQYARDSGARGYGIYLVLWFGEGDSCRTPPPTTGARPDAPDALKASLEATLAPNETRRISICVIDVSAREGKMLPTHVGRSPSARRPVDSVDKRGRD